MQADSPVGEALYGPDWGFLHANPAAWALLVPPGQRREAVGGLVPVPPRAAARRREPAGTWPGAPLTAGMHLVSLPYSRYLDFALPGGASRGFLAHYAATGRDRLVRFEPAESCLGFIQTLPFPAAWSDERGFVVLANPGLLDLLDMPSSAVVGQTVAHAGRDLAFQPLGGHVDGADGLCAGTFTCRPPGRYARAVRVNRVPWRHCGCLCGHLWVATDDGEAAEAASHQLAAAVWLKASATFQHELRNPLQTMQAAADVLRPHVAGGGRRALHILEQQIRCASEYLTEQMRPPALSGMARGRLSDVVRVEIERAALRPCTRDLTVSHRPPRGEPLVRLHAGAMGRVLANLFRNSAQARRDALVVIRYFVGSRHIECQIADNGPGFAPELLGGDWLQAPGDPPGQLGLAIVAATLQAHGGTVNRHNGAAGGAVVSLRLPLAETTAAIEAATAAVQAAAAAPEPAGDRAPQAPQAPLGPLCATG